MLLICVAACEVFVVVVGYFIKGGVGSILPPEILAYILVCISKGNVSIVRRLWIPARFMHARMR